MRIVSIALIGGCASGAPDTGSDTAETGSADCEVVETATGLVGASARSCGLVPLGDPLADAWACAVEAFEAGHPFWIVWENFGTDTALVDGMVSDGSRVVQLHQDQEDAPPWRIDGHDCVGPYVGEADDPDDAIDEAGLTRVACTGREPPGNHYEICGTCTGCSAPGLPFVWP